jgi:pimeloyl-ACP methyl ester carboxylesterase
MHGHGRTAQDFDVLAQDLSPQFRVICPQFGPLFAGDGQSDGNAALAQPDFAQMLTDLDGLMLDLGIDEVDWIGASLGGILGMHLAVQPGVSIRRLVMKNIGEGMPLEPSRQPEQPLSAPLAGVHSVDLWKRIKCPTVLLRGDAPAVSSCEAKTIRRFLMQDAHAPRVETHACVAA